jgi:outer membrane protein assembly factor BamB
MAARVRAIPLAVLVSAALVLAITRGTRRSSPAHVEVMPPPVPESSGDPPSRSLAAAMAAEPARVAEHAGRMLHEDARHTHRARGHVPAHGLLAWKLATDGPIEAQVASSPDGQTLYVATLGGSLWAVTRQGTKRWVTALGGRAYGSPAVAEDGTVYVGSDAGFFHAISPAGEVKWRLETGADADTGAVFSPEGNIVFASGSSVFAVRPSGDVAWRFTAKGKVFTSPAVTADGLFVFGSQDDHAYALDRVGALVWAADLGADVDGAPTIGDDGGIYVGTDRDEVVRLGSHGEIVWRTNVGGFVRGTLSMARNGDVLVGVYGPSPRQVRVTAGGVVRGSFAVQGTGARQFGVHGGALEDDDGTMVFGAQDDRLYTVGLDGKLRWAFLTGGDVDAPATLLADGTLIAGSDDGILYAISDSPPTVVPSRNTPQAPP